MPAKDLVRVVAYVEPDVAAALTRGKEEAKAKSLSAYVADVLTRVARGGGTPKLETGVPKASGGTPTPQVPVRTDLSTLKRDPEDAAEHARAAAPPIAKSKETGHPFEPQGARPAAPFEKRGGFTVLPDRERDYEAADLGPAPGQRQTVAVPGGSSAEVTPPPGGWDAWTQPRAPISPLPPSDAPRPTIDPRTLPESRPGALPGSLEEMIAKSAPTLDQVVDPSARAAVARLDLDAIRHVEVSESGEEEVDDPAVDGFTISPPVRRDAPPPPDATGDAHGFDFRR